MRLAAREEREETDMLASLRVSITAAMGIPKLEAGPQKSGKESLC